MRINSHAPEIPWNWCARSICRSAVPDPGLVLSAVCSSCNSKGSDESAKPSKQENACPLTNILTAREVPQTTASPWLYNTHLLVVHGHGHSSSRRYPCHSCQDTFVAELCDELLQSFSALTRAEALQEGVIGSVRGQAAVVVRSLQRLVGL